MSLCDIDQAGLELLDSPASASPVLGLRACGTTLCKIIFSILMCIVVNLPEYVYRMHIYRAPDKSEFLELKLVVFMGYCVHTGNVLGNRIALSTCNQSHLSATHFAFCDRVSNYLSWS